MLLNEIFMYNMDYYYGNYSSENYLRHYGVKGMKWGIRRATNELRSAHEGELINRGSHNHGYAMLYTHEKKINKKLLKLKNQEIKIKKKTHKTSIGKKIASEQLAKNKKLQSVFKKGLKEIDKETTKKGYDFLYIRPNGYPYTTADTDVFIEKKK